MFIPIVLLLALAIQAPALPRFTITDLGSLPVNASDFKPGLNANGVVVTWVNQGDTLKATLWEKGKSTALGDLTDYPQTLATDVNSRNAVVGTARSASDKRFTRAFYYRAGSLSDLGTIGGKYAKAYALNDSDLVAGASETVKGDIHAVYWQWQDGKPTGCADLGTLGMGRFSEAHDINAVGNVTGIGEIVPGGKKHAFLWNRKSRKMQDLGLFPGGSLSNARALNDRDEVVGWADTDESELHAVLWSLGKMTDLGTLGEEPTVAWDINNQSQIVGTSALDEKRLHAFLWIKGVMHDLNDLVPAPNGWTLREAHRINDKGKIIGLGTIQGHAHLFLLTPIP